jgi:triosephosphate isomerase
VVVAGNWKMNHGPEQTRAFLAAFRPASGPGRPTVLIFPPAVSLAAALEADARGVQFGVQNIHWEDSGAFTGEIGAPIARAAGATHTLVGHSERRQLFGETDDHVARKASAALRHGLTPVVCVGETLAERRAGRVDEVILRQLDAALGGLAQGGDFLLAYEPVWAIGTGENATPRDAGEAHGTLRRRLVERLGARGREASILYGGSVKPDNAAALMAAPDVDGVLVGGASLDPGSFARILEAAPNR